MNDKQKELIYSSVLADTKGLREDVLNFWLSCGDDLSEGEEKELDDNFEHLKKVSDYCTTLAVIALEEADSKMDFLNTLQQAEKMGCGLVRVDGEDDEDDDDFDVPEKK